MTSPHIGRSTLMFAGLTLLGGCKNKCENAYERTVGLFQEDHSIPAGPKDALLNELKTDAARAKALEACKTQKPDELACVLKAEDYAAVLTCTGGVPTNAGAAQTTDGAAKTTDGEAKTTDGEAPSAAPATDGTGH
jgi:hypothetical protein